MNLEMPSGTPGGIFLIFIRYRGWISGKGWQSDCMKDNPAVMQAVKAIAWNFDPWLIGMYGIMTDTSRII